MDNINQYSFCEYGDGTTRVVICSGKQVYDAVINNKELINRVRGEKRKRKDLLELKRLVMFKSSEI